MIRFRNPGTQLSTQINVFKVLYSKLKDEPYFGIKEMADVIAKGHLLTAYGYGGDNALQLSMTEEESKNSAYMNAKMYAEVFRMLGWVTPFDKKSYPIIFTIIGKHIALSDGYSEELVEECILGISNPTELTDNFSYDENVRFFKCALNALNDLDGIMYKHELCIGPMSVNDINQQEYSKMILKVKQLRGNIENLKKAFSNLASSLGMKETPVDNCTRIPIAFLKWAGYVDTINNYSLYNKNLLCLQLTQKGRNTLTRINKMKDIRLKDFVTYTKDKQLALIRLGVYGMLERSGYDLSEVSESIIKDKALCNDILQDNEILFSPCQTLRHSIIDEAFGIIQDTNEQSYQIINNTNPKLSIKNNNTNIEIKVFNYKENKEITNDDTQLIDSISRLKNEGWDKEKITNIIFDNCISYTQNKFYPFVASLFRIMGFKCSFSRPGDNGARWDAIIEDEERSIPIEIKSPTEELHLSLKAMRQAVENKIILLSRKTYKTEQNVSSLIVGYHLPNERAEVNKLTTDYKKTYDISIGILSIKTLIETVVKIVYDEISLDKEAIYYLEGIINEIIWKN